MHTGYEKLFKSLTIVDPPKELHHRIVTRIAIIERQTMRIRLALFGIFSIASFGAIVLALQYTLQEFTRSGFYQYFSLLLSDGGTIFVYWKEFAFLLAESLPVFGVILLLSSTVVFLFLLRYATKNIKTILLPA